MLSAAGAWLASPAGLWFMVAIGAFLRLHRYLAHLSLEVGEAELALNLQGRSYAQLLLPLDNDQGAPVGFLFVERFFVTTWGNHEYALRLFPLLCSLAALPLMVQVARRYLSGLAVPVAVGLFAFSRWVVIYAGHAKQYAGDVTVALLLLLLAESAWRRRTERGPMLALAAAGAVAIWFSHSATFVIAGAGACLALGALRERDWALARRLGLAGAVWGASLALLYAVSLRHLTASPYLLAFWADAFMPLPPRSLNDLRWYVDAPLEMFMNPGGFTAYYLAAGLAVIGAVGLLRGRLVPGLMLLAPFPLTLLASALRQYPFSVRLILFLVPILVLLVAEGLDMLRRSVPSRLPYAALLAVLAYGPLLAAALAVREPGLEVDQPRSVIAYLGRHHQAGDVVYVYQDARYAYEYYAPRSGLAGANARVGRDRASWAADTADIRDLMGNERVWFLFSHVWDRNTPTTEEDFFLFELNRRGGRLLAEQRAPGAAVYLYDLRGAAGDQ